MATLAGCRATIIGAGIFGLTAARALARRAAKVRVMEQGRVGHGASGGIVGALAPHMPEKWNPKKAFQRDALLSITEYWQAIADEAGSRTIATRPGRLIPIRTAEQRTLALSRVGEARLWWPEAANFEVIDDVPDLPRPPFGWIFETLSARLMPRDAVAALATALTRSGVEIVEQSVVTSPEVNSDIVVVSAGYESGHLLPDLGPGFIRGVKGQALMLDHDLGSSPVIYDDGLYVVPHPGQGTAIGSTSEPTWDDPTRVDQSELNRLHARAAELVPALAEADRVQSWAGVRPRARYPDPVLGPIDGRPGVFLFTGGFKIGFGIAHHLAEALADMIEGAAPDLPERFHLAAQRPKDIVTP